MKAIGVALWVCGVAAATAQPLLNPHRNHRAVALPFLRMPASGPALAEGRRFELSIAVANDFRMTSDVIEDAEVIRLGLRLAWASRLGEVWTEIPHLTRGGGFLDPLIDAWHDRVLGWSDPVRGSTRFGDAIIARRSLYSFGPASGLGDITIGFGRDLGRFTVRAGFKIPTGDPARLLGSGGFDVGAAVERGWRLGPRWESAAQIGYVLQGSSRRLPGARAQCVQASLAVGLWTSSRDRWALQWSHEDAPIDVGVPAIDSGHRQILITYTRVTNRGNFDIFLAEDRDIVNGRRPELANIAPDVSLGMRWTSRF
jgi:hypothetical protein